MKILLDTTYLLPLIGVSVNGIPNDFLLRLIGKGHSLYVSSVSLFELMAKGAKYTVKGLVPIERVLRGIQALIYDDRIAKVTYTDLDILAIAIRLRTELEDFIDCIMLSTALNCCNAILTEDRDIHRLKETPWFNELVKEVNPSMIIMDLAEYTRTDL